MIHNSQPTHFYFKWHDVDEKKGLTTLTARSLYILGECGPLKQISLITIVKIR